MNSIKTTFALTLLSLASLGIAAPGCKTAQITDDEPTPVLRAPALTAAHNAFLDGDNLTMVQRVKDVLMDKNVDQLAKDNALELLEKGYESTQGRLPADWSLPVGFEPMRYKQERSELADGPHLEVRLDGRVDDIKRIKNITLSRDGQVILDIETKVGRWYPGTPEKDGMTYYSLVTRALPAFPAPGVMTVHLAYADGSVTDGWFINDRFASSAAPVVTEPTAEASVRTANPTVKWLPFRSPESSLYEHRELILWLSRRNDDGTYAKAWSTWSAAADRTEARIGVSGQGGMEVELANGDYELDVNFDETRRFGPMKLGRRSSRSVSLHVAR